MHESARNCIVEAGPKLTKKVYPLLDVQSLLPPQPHLVLVRQTLDLVVIDLRDCPFANGKFDLPRDKPVESLTQVRDLVHNLLLVLQQAIDDSLEQSDEDGRLAVEVTVDPGSGNPCFSSDIGHGHGVKTAASDEIRRGAKNLLPARGVSGPPGCDNLSHGGSQSWISTLRPVVVIAELVTHHILLDLAC